MAGITSPEILALFSQASALNNSDQFLLHGAEGVSGNHAIKITAEAVRTYLMQGFSITIGQDGYWYIGGVSTGVKAEGVTPEFVRRSDGIYVTVDGVNYQPVAYFTDFNSQPVVNQTLTTTSINPNVLNVWGAVSSLNISLIAGTSGMINEYKMEFTVNSSSFTLQLPSSVIWQEDPVWENGYKYQVSIVDNLAIYAGWEAASS